MISSDKKAYPAQVLSAERKISSDEREFHHEPHVV
jgi:hypothetical protein